jgi:16S rRNA (guanine527-N7)-methyltransferase
VVRGRAEEQPTDAFGVAVAKALAPPPVAAEWCLPLVRPGGYAVLFVGPTADVGAAARAAAQVGGGEPELRDGLLTIPKVAPTPARFPRRPGVARKRPLA